MAIIQSIILGIIQGTTEFLPISSSAHLVLVPWLFGWDYNGLAFDTALHFGTAIAIVAYFWRDWTSIIARAIMPNNVSRITYKGKENHKLNTLYEIPTTMYPPNLLWQILVASIPAAIAGYFLSNYVETYLHSPILLAINLAVFGIILYLVDITVAKNEKRKAKSNNSNLKTDCHPEPPAGGEGSYSSDNTTMSESASDNNETPRLRSGQAIQQFNNLTIGKIGYAQSFIVGLAQCLALIPGVSRSGITLTAARSLGLSRENSARFSFLLSTPAILGAFAFTATKTDWSSTPVGFWLSILVTTIVGFLTIKYLLKYLQRGSFVVFTIYRVALAIIIVVLFLMR